MVDISTFVFTKINTTGRIWEGKPQYITEIYMSAISREDIETDGGLREIVFTTLVQPPAYLSSEAANATALNYDDLADAPIFENIIDQLNNYLNSFPKPICLVAQNGRSYDFKVLRNETENAKKTLPTDLLMADFKHIFYNIFKEESGDTKNKIKQSIEAFCAKLEVELNGKETAKSWVDAMINCVMKRRVQFLIRAEGQYRNSFYENAE